MTRIAINIAGLLLAVTSLCVTGASAASLLGVVGTNGDSGVVTLSGGQAQTNGVVNVGLGVSSSNPNNVANVGIGGGSTPLATANVSSGGSSGVLSVDANVGNGLANVAVGVGGSGSGNGGTGGGGGGGTGGGTGGIGGNGGVGGSGGPGGLIVVGNGGGGGGFTVTGPGCNEGNSAQVFQMVAGSKYSNRIVSGWSHATNIQVVPVKVCAAARANLAAVAATNRTFGIMQQAVRSDPLINTSLSRAKSHAGRVLAVDQAGPTVTVYVY